MPPELKAKSPAVANVAPADRPTTGPRLVRGKEQDQPKRLLVVDDEAVVTQALARFLRSRGYEVETASSGEEALTVLTGSAFSLLLCDVRMPGMSGIDLVPRAMAIDSDLGVMMLSGVNDAPTATLALSTGALDYILKPVELPDLQRAVERALHRRELEIDRRSVERMIRDEAASRAEERERERLTLRTVSISTIEALVNAMEAKDIYLRGHSHRVAELSAAIAAELGLDLDTIECVRIAARIHDIGKIGIRESVLNKPAPLTREEYEHVKEHVRIGMEILAPLKHLGLALDFVQDHHEHWDGQGYPHGKAGEEISMGGRILAASDAFDSLTSQRAYRLPRRPIEAVEYLAARSGDLLQPPVYLALARVIERRKSLVADSIQE
jgi:putative two-component system response regulator